MKKFAKLMDDNEFMNAISSAQETTGASTVAFNRIEEIIQETLND